VVVTVIVAVPAETAVTVPSLTFATLVSLDDHVTDWSVASVGVIVAVRVLLSPTAIESEDELRLTPVTATVSLVTNSERHGSDCDAYREEWRDRHC
jgi:hypothetical protein